jgi:HEAT repeat protein
VEAKDAVPAITKLLLDKDRDIRLNAVNALGNIGSEDGVPALIKALGKPEEDWSILDSAAEALTRIGTLEGMKAVEDFHQQQTEDVNFD